MHWESSVISTEKEKCAIIIYEIVFYWCTSKMHIRCLGGGERWVRDERKRGMIGRWRGESQRWRTEMGERLKTE